MSGRKTFTAGEVLQAADVNDYLMDQSVMVFAGTAARGSAIPSPTEGMVTYLSDADELQVYTTAWGAVGGGKILQVVRATDSTNRSTSSTSYVDASLSVTITPQRSTSAILLIASYRVIMGTAGQNTFFAITDSSNNVISGSEEAALGGNDVNRANISSFAYATPATTSATTYKTRFKVSGGAATTLENSDNTAQLFAIEVAA